MDPVTLIVTALAAGAASALQDDAKAAVKGAYARLRELVKKRLAGRASADLILAQHETAPDTWEKPLRAELEQAGAADDAGIVTAARALMQLVDGAGAKAGKYVVNVQNSHGVQFGDHNAQANYFGTGTA